MADAETATKQDAAKEDSEGQHTDHSPMAAEAEREDDAPKAKSKVSSLPPTPDTVFSIAVRRAEPPALIRAFAPPGA